jgi:hypothetical protein
MSFEIMEFPSAYWLQYYWSDIPGTPTFGPTLRDIKIFQIYGIPKPEPPEEYTGVVGYKDRAFIYGNPDKRLLQYSAESTPDAWNGNDSGFVSAGDRSEIIATAPFFNEMLIAKQSGELGLVGQSGRFLYERISATSGPIAPRSMIPIEAGLMTGGDERRPATIYLSADGFRYFDGLKTPILSEDIKAYFDPNHDLFVGADVLDDAWAWIDHPNQEYHCLMVGTDPLIEFVYNFQYGKWTIFEREEAISGAISVRIDNEWVVLAFGDDGYVYELETELTDNGSSISYSVETGDIPFSENDVVNFRGTLVKGSTVASSTIAASYALDGATSYTSLGSLNSAKANYNFHMDDERMNIKGHSIRWKFVPSARMDLYSHTTYFMPERDLREQPGN